MGKLLKTLLIIFVLGLFAFNVNNKITKGSNIPNEKTVRDFKANLTINTGTDTFIFDAEPFVGKSAQDATKALTNNKFVMTGNGKDTYISEINGKKIDPSKREFWELFVNGISSKISSDKYIIQKGDQIEWHINLHS